MAEECYCEVQGCRLPGSICPMCEQCLCWQHLQSSSCEACHRLLTDRSLEHRLGRLMGIGLDVLLCGLFLLLLPRDDGRITIQVAVLFLVGGFLVFWLGLLTSRGV